MSNPVDYAQFKGFWGKGAPQKKILSKDSNNNPLYIATGPRGVATSTPNWIVEKLVWDSDGDYSYSQHSDFNQIADNYLALDYK